jgi:hypothetical protein
VLWRRNSAKCVNYSAAQMTQMNYGNSVTAFLILFFAA